MSTIKETKTTTKSEQVAIGHKCDICGKEEKSSWDVPDHWHTIRAGHQGWGNDSVESWEHFDVCSPECYSKCFKTEVERIKEYVHHGGQVDDMEIEFAIKFAEFLP